MATDHVNDDEVAIDVSTTEEKDQGEGSLDEQYVDSRTVGVIIGVLLTIISLLLGGILYVAYRNKKCVAKTGSTPTHSLLTRKFTDRFSTSIDFKDMHLYNNHFNNLNTSGSASAATSTIVGNKPGSLYGQMMPSTRRVMDSNQEETIYEEPLGDQHKMYGGSGGFLSLNHRKFSSDPALSEDCTDEYAEPGVGGVNSNSFSENIYAQALPPPVDGVVNNTVNRNLPPLPISHYARPLSPMQPPIFTSSPDQISTTTATPIMVTRSTPNARVTPSSFMNNSAVGAIVLPPPPPTTGSIMMSGTTSTSASSSTVGLGLTRSPPQEMRASVKSRGVGCNSSSKSRKKSSSRSSSRKNSTSELSKTDQGGYYASAEVINRQNSIDMSGFDLAKLYAQINKNAEPLLSKPTRSISIDTVAVELNEIPRRNMTMVEKFGEGQFGEIHLCRLNLQETDNLPEELSTNLVAVKSLRIDCDDGSKYEHYFFALKETLNYNYLCYRSDFEHEARILTSLNDPNLVRVLGVCFKGEPMSMICEYTEEGDLYQFLQDHVAETSLSKSPGVPTLRYVRANDDDRHDFAIFALIFSYGCLIYIASQIASGMKYLESLNFVHRDLATR